MKKKSLEEMLVEQAEAAKATGRWAAFLTVWDEVQASYAKGWKYKDIWKALHKAGMFGYGYSTFMYCIQRMRRRQEEIAGGGTIKPPAPKRSPVKPPPVVPGSNRTGLPTFGEGLPERDPKRF